jgi:hypothetical protein
MKVIALLLPVMLIAACGNKSNDNGGAGGKSVPANRVNWATVPAEFNPSIFELPFRTDNAEKLDVDLFGFKDDVEVVYADMPPNSGTLRAYRVYKRSASFGDLRAQSNGTSMDLKNYGRYECSIRVVNGQITELEGGCYVRLQIFMPIGSRVEVYNAGQLLTKRFVPISTDSFLKNLRNATWSDQKFTVINEFLASYAGSGRAAALTSEDLRTVLRSFIRSEEKFRALGQLHMTVTDRHNLAAILDREFIFRERDEARRITGL